MKRKRKIKKSFLIKIFILLLIIIGLVVYLKNRNNDVPITPEPENTPVQEEKKEEKPNTFLGNVTNTCGIEINDKWQDTIVKYMDIYYDSLYDLNTKDVTGLFTDSSSNEAYLTQKAIELIVKHHSMQMSDMKLTYAKYDINYKKVTNNGSTVTIEFLENDNFKFKYLKNIESKAYDIQNTIILKKSDSGEYTIESLRIIQGYYIMFTNVVDMKSTSAKSKIDNLEEKYLKEMQTEVENNKKLQQQAATPYSSSKTYSHPYNREDALKYANTYVDKRNNQYGIFDSSGGNCQNFASQCVHEGGIPMDYKGSAQWKYYSNNINNSETASGRTVSWLSTNSFYEYASNNTGYGLVADTATNIFYGEAGDIAQVGYNGYSHTTIVVDQVKNEQGEVIDLLINCNTVSLKNYPLLGYVYYNKRLIKILGYND